MIIFDRKKVAGAAAARTSEDGRVDLSHDERPELMVLVKDIKKAITSGSDEELLAALKAFVHECSESYEE